MDFVRRPAVHFSRVVEVSGGKRENAKVKYVLTGNMCRRQRKIVYEATGNRHKRGLAGWRVLSHLFSVPGTSDER